MHSSGRAALAAWLLAALALAPPLGADAPEAEDASAIAAEVETLGAALSDPDERARYAAVDGLLELGRTSDLALQRLDGALEHPDESVQLHAATALTELGTRAAKVLPALVAALSDPSEGVRETVIVALFLIGPEAASALPALERIAAEDDDPYARRSAQDAIRRIRARARS